MVAPCGSYVPTQPYARCSGQLQPIQFIGVPKTASTWMQNVLTAFAFNEITWAHPKVVAGFCSVSPANTLLTSFKHSPAWLQLAALHEAALPPTYSFAIVRDPLDRAVSSLYFEVHMGQTTQLVAVLGGRLDPLRHAYAYCRPLWEFRKFCYES